MNLLSLCGALMTATASVSAGPISSQVNHQNKMMEVSYKYQSNEVNDWRDIFEGNIYKFNLSTWNPSSYLVDGGFQLELLTETSFEASTIEEVQTYEEIHLKNVVVEFYATDVYVYWSYDDALSGVNYIDYSSYTFLEDGIFLVKRIWSDSLEFADSFDSFDDNGIFPYEYTSYNELVPSTTHRGNLYTTIYDFFYGIFDTSDTNELSMNIMGQNMNLTSWLAHTVTIVLLLLGVLWLILVIRWIFRVFSGLVKI